MTVPQNGIKRHKLLPSSGFGWFLYGNLLLGLVDFYMELPILICSLLETLLNCNVKQNSWPYVDRQLNSIFKVELDGFTSTISFFIRPWFRTQEKTDLKSTLSGACAALYASPDECFPHFAPCKEIQESLWSWMDSMLWILDSRYWIPDSLSVELGLRIPVAAGFRISGLSSRFQKLNFRIQSLKFRIPRA